MDRLSDMLQHLVPEPVASLEPVHLERLSVSLPVELYVRGGARLQSLEASAPSQSFATTIMPAFHRLDLGIVADEIAGATP